MMQIGVWCGAAMLLACVLTGLVKRYALTLNLVDVPNHRSSHVLPTPRGGGLGIVLTFLCLLPVVASHWIFIFLIGAGIGLLGFLDDCFSIPAKLRLILQIVLAGLIIRELPDLGLFKPEILLSGCLLLYLVWLTNLYNFMDGIDGLASLEAITVCLAMVALYLNGGVTDLWVLPLLLTCCIVGFLIWNFPPAKIFMGDVGSGFLGLLLGVFSLQAGAVDHRYFWCWVILLGVFIVDATFTLLRRFYSGQAVMQAHRTHAYQYASRILQSHLKVTLGTVMINIFWLFPWAYAVSQSWISGITGVVLSYFPLVILAWALGAGRLEKTG